NAFAGTSAFEWAMRRRGLHLGMRGTAAYPRIELPKSFDEYLASLPRKRRKDLRRHLRRLDDGVIEITRVQEPSAIRAALARWLALKSSWWEAREGEMHRGQRDPRFLSFLRDLMVVMSQAGLGEVWELRHEGRVAGVDVNLLDRRTFYSWLGGYDPSIAHLGPGKIA